MAEYGVLYLRPATITEITVDGYFDITSYTHSVVTIQRDSIISLPDGDAAKFYCNDLVYGEPNYPYTITADGYAPLTGYESLQYQNNIKVMSQYISKLSNGTNTYILKDSEARNSIETVQNNLVTSVTSSSTDSQYPSAKCVYDLFGSVENQISEVNSKVTMATATITINKLSQYVTGFIIDEIDYKDSFVDSQYTSSAEIQLPKGETYNWTFNWSDFAFAFVQGDSAHASMSGTLLGSVDLTSGNNTVVINLTNAAP